MNLPAITISEKYSIGIYFYCEEYYHGQIYLSNFILRIMLYL